MILPDGKNLLKDYPQGIYNGVKISFATETRKKCSEIGMIVMKRLEKGKDHKRAESWKGYWLLTTKKK